MLAETASILAEADGGWEICILNHRYTFPVASSGCISPLELPAAANVHGTGTPSGTPDPSLRLRFVQDDNTAASSMVTRNVFLSVAKNLEKKGRATDREHVTFVSY